MHKMTVILMFSVMAVLTASVAGAGEEEQEPSSPPLPFHTVEGTSGVFLREPEKINYPNGASPGGGVVYALPRQLPPAVSSSSGQPIAFSYAVTLL